MPADYALRRNWYSLYLSCKHNMTGEQALQSMGLLKYHRKSKFYRIPDAIQQQVKTLAESGINYKDIGFQLHLQYDEVRHIIRGEYNK